MKYFLKPNGSITGYKIINSTIEAKLKKIDFKECDIDGKLIIAKKATTKKKK